VTRSPDGLVSIIMPFLNARPFIAEAIESVRAQTHPDWELWLVDDGSTDGTADVARSFAARDPTRIRLLTHPGGGTHGASASRNRGLAQATGEFVAFLDADDVWLPENLAELVRRLRAAPEAGVVCSRSLYWYSWAGESGGRDFIPRHRAPEGRPIEGVGFLALCIQGKASVPCPCSILVRRSVIERTGGFEEQFPQLYDDQVLYAKLFLSTMVLLDGGCWAKYRRHSASTTMTAERERNFRPWRLAYLTWLEQYAGRDAATAAALRPALRRELWRCRHPLGDWLLDQAAFLRSRAERVWTR
jgi:glycosyltransferase involved in cell wall biosynthesis